MSRSLTLDIVEQLDRFLAGHVSLDELNGWLAQHTWNVHRIGSQSAVDLTFEIEGILAQFDHGDLTQAQLKDRLRPLTQRHLFLETAEPLVGFPFDAPLVPGTKTYLSRPGQKLIFYSGSRWSEAA